MYDNVYEKAEEIIRNRRKESEEENKRRNIEIKHKIPEIAEIKEKYMDSMGTRLLEIIQSGENVQQKIENEKRYNAQAVAMIHAYLYGNGYPMDYLEMHYVCSECSDTGYNNGRRCKCFGELLKELSLEHANKNMKEQFPSFKEFDLSYYKDKSNEKSMHKIYNYCVNYAKNFNPNKSANILMCGGTGVGKTHLSLAIAREVAQNGYNVVFDTSMNFLRHIENEHFKSAEYETDTIETMINADLLVIDDLGSEFGTRFSNFAVYNVISSRLARIVPTIINTNLTFEEIDLNYDERITSRFGAFYDYLKITSDDMRFLIKKSKK